MRIDPKRRAGSPTPGVFPRRAQDWRAGWIEHDRKPQAKPHPGIGRFRKHARLGELGQLLPAWEMIHGHQLHRLAPQQADPIQLSAVTQHGSKAEVIAYRCNQPAATREKAALTKLAALWGVDQAQAAITLPLVVTGETS